MIFDIYSALIHPVAVSGRQCEPVVLRQKVSQIRKAGGRRFRNGGGGGRLRFPAEFEVGPVLIHPVVVSDCNSLLRNVMGPVRPGRAEINACRCRCGNTESEGETEYDSGAAKNCPDRKGHCRAGGILRFPAFLFHGIVL